jgi:aldehyde:ferredoxin oxidoreductase
MMEFLYNGSILVVDLAAGSAEEVPFPEGFIADYLGGARANLALLDLYPEADLVLGSGPFTALPVPGACLGVATLKDGDRITHTPLHLFAGMELKLSGFDFVVLQGTAPDPVYLWLHDGIADISPASSLPRDNWEAVDALRRELGEDLVQVLLAGTGPCLNLGYWAGTDRVGLGRAFNDKGLRAVCARGLGILDAADPEAFAETCVSLVGEVRDSLPAGRHGLEGIVSLLEGRECDYPSSLLHRRRACFACPYDCNIYLKTEEDPSSMAQEGVDEPGMLLTDARALALMEEKGLSPADGVRLLRRAARLGAYPCGSVAAGSEASDSDLAACAAAPWEGEESPFSPWAPTRTLYEGGDWRERQALAYTMGICPVLMLLSPVLTPEVFAGLLGQGMELEVSPDEVVRICLEA